MTTYQAYYDFSAQSRSVRALMAMYRQLEQSAGQEVELTPIVVFMAFSIESYLNSIGARKIEIWDEIERLSWKKKVSILHKVANKIPDWSKDPLQFAGEIFKLRDNLAHGRPERVVGPLTQDPGEADKLIRSDKLQPDWYSVITGDWIIKGKERFHALMVYLGGIFNLHESDHLLMATGGVIIHE